MFCSSDAEEQYFTSQKYVATQQNHDVATYHKKKGGKTVHCMPAPEPRLSGDWMQSECDMRQPRRLCFDDKNPASFCDRIIFANPSGSFSTETIVYTSTPLTDGWSDHMPVAGLFKLQFGHEDADQEEFRERRGTPGTQRVLKP